MTLCLWAGDLRPGDGERRRQWVNALAEIARAMMAVADLSMAYIVVKMGEAGLVEKVFAVGDVEAGSGQVSSGSKRTGRRGTGYAPVSHKHLAHVLLDRSVAAFPLVCN